MISRWRPNLTQMLALPSKNFKAAVTAVFREVTALEINGKSGVPRTETETREKNQMEITELKARRPIIKNS